MATISSGIIANERLLHFGMWIAQAALACFFAVMACLKLMLPAERLIELMAWAASVPLPLVRALGVCELLAAIAVAAPAVTRAPQRVVGVTAVFLLTLMMSAAVVHLVRGEPRMLMVNLTVAALAAFVAWGRLTHAPLEEVTAH
ncbi:MAG: putative integral rane protein [Myxococcaceae bacterium]|nr:putative integral rane protein [Myxococcaceae bacterium]